MKKYTIEITDDGKTTRMSRKNDGFSAMELIGFMEMIKQDLINQFKGIAEDKVDIITKQAVKRNEGSEQLVNFLLHLNDKGLINNYDFDYEKEAKKYLEKTNCH